MAKTTERRNIQEKVECINDEGRVKLLTRFTIENGGARRNGFRVRGKSKIAQAPEPAEIPVGKLPVTDEELTDGIPTEPQSPTKRGRKPVNH